MEYIPLISAIISVLGFVITVIVFLIDRKKDREKSDEALKKKTEEDTAFYVETKLILEDLRQDMRDVKKKVEQEADTRGDLEKKVIELEASIKALEVRMVHIEQGM